MVNCHAYDCVFLIFSKVSIIHVLVTKRWPSLRATHCMLAWYALRKFCLSVCLSQYQYHYTLVSYLKSITILLQHSSLHPVLFI